MNSGFVLVPITPQKHDPAWRHCQMFKNGDRIHLKCLYCNKLFRGGGIHRIKEHLACQKGNASTCIRVPPEVMDVMRESLEGVSVKKRKKQKLDEEIINVNAINGEIDAFSNQGDVNSELHMIGLSPGFEPDSALLESQEDGSKENKRKRGRRKSSSVMNVIDAVPISNSGLNAFKPVSNHLHMAIGRFLYDIGASLDSVNSIYFQPMVDAIISAGPGVGLPTYHDIRGWILKNSVEEVRNDIEKCKATWGRTGCSVLVDQSHNEMGRIVLTFLVYCPEGVVFLESVEATKITKSPDALYELIKKVVDEVGVKHVLQVITNSDDLYSAAGKRLTDCYPTLYWTPCATQCIDLILEDFANIDLIKRVIEQARTITRFVYNNSSVLNMVRRYTFGKDIMEQSITRSATNFTTLKRMAELKHNLQAMITLQEWMDCPYAKSPGGLEMLDIISSQSFWSSCLLIIRLTDPLLRVLRIASSKRRPSMGYFHAGLYRAKERIKSELVKREEYIIYWNIIDQRSEQLWSHPLHAAGFYLNPKFFYSVEGDMPTEIVSGMFDCIERLVSDTSIQDKIIKEMNLYKNAAGDLGRNMAIRARDTLLPAEWWSTYGGGCPNLTRLAIRILSQTCSMTRFRQQNPIPFEKVHETRNQLEHQRLDDLLLVHHNLHIKQMVTEANDQDPVDNIAADGLSYVEDWVKRNELSLEDYGSSDWKELDPPSSTVCSGASNDDIQALAAGFDDPEILKRVTEGDEDKKASDNKPILETSL